MSDVQPRAKVLGQAAAMAAGEKLEQAVTHRPNSYIPGGRFMTLLGRHPDDDVQPTAWNQVMHYGTGAILGALRGVWAVTGIRVPRANLTHTRGCLRLPRISGHLTS